MISYACSGLCNLAYHSEDTFQKIQEVINAISLSRLVELLASNDDMVVLAALSLLVALLCGTSHQKDLMFRSGCLKYIRKLLFHTDKTIVHLSTKAIRNITTGTPDEIQAIIEAGVIPVLIQILQDGDTATKFEAMCAINNITFCGTSDQILLLCQPSVLKVVCNMLTVEHFQTVYYALHAIRQFMLTERVSGDFDRMVYMMETFGGFNMLEVLQTHQDKRLSSVSLQIMNDYFSQLFLRYK